MANSEEGPNTQGLADYRWQHRVIITRAESPLALVELNKRLAPHWPALEERKIAIFVILESEEDEIKRIFKDRKESPELSKQEVNKRLGKKHTLLIGLDGGSKSVYDSFDLRQIMADIDAMPMRRAEQIR